MIWYELPDGDQDQIFALTWFGMNYLMVWTQIGIIEWKIGQCIFFEPKSRHFHDPEAWSSTVDFEN